MKKSFILGFLTALILTLSTPVIAKTVLQTVNVVINGKTVQGGGIIYNGSAYIPLRKAGEALGLEVNYDNISNTAKLDSKVIETIEETKVEKSQSDLPVWEKDYTTGELLTKLNEKLKLIKVKNDNDLYVKLYKLPYGSDYIWDKMDKDAREAFLREKINEMKKESDAKLIVCSIIYETKTIGNVAYSPITGNTGINSKNTTDK